MVTNPPPLDFPLQIAEQVAMITMPQRLTVIEAVPFKAFVSELLTGHPLPQQIKLDLGETQFLDSSGVGALVQVLKLTQGHQIPLILCRANPPVLAVLGMTGLDKIFTLESLSPGLTPSQTTGVSAAPDVLPPRTHPSIRSPLKRAVDIIGSLVGLAITGVLAIPIAIAIKLDSPGPILFAQTRLGWLGKPFKILKFRSMCTDAEALKSQIKNEVEGAIFKNKNDPRITKVGKFLRKTSLDELPQFWNVLKGEMSLVGTRPPTPDEVEQYEVPAWQRLDVKPGMTGEWQVNGRSSITKFEDIIKLDLRYQENWSHLYDLKLILKTIFILFNKKSGAA